MREDTGGEQGSGRTSRLLWAGGTVGVGVLFWGWLYFDSLQVMQEQLRRAQAAVAQAERELPTPQAQPELARVEKELGGLKQRGETTTAAALSRQLEAHGVTLLGARPGEPAGTFVLELEGSSHGLGLALPELEEAAAAGRWPAVLYFRRVKQDQRLRARFTVEGVGQVSDWSLPPAPPAER